MGQDNIALAPDGKTVAQGDYLKGVVHLWDVASGKELRQMTGHKQGAYGVAFIRRTRKAAVVSGRSLTWGPPRPPPTPATRAA